VAMGEVYFRQGKLVDAENQFGALIRQGTKEARAYLGLSRGYEAASYHKQAKLMIDRAHTLDPGDPDIRRAWIGTLGSQERLKALQDYLSSETNDDAEMRRRLEEHLAILQHESAESIHPCSLTASIPATETPLERMLRDSRSLRGVGLRVNMNDV